MRSFYQCFAILLLLFSCQAFGQSLTTYMNARFGFSVMYPSDFQMDPPPENGDGRQFSKSNGCIIIASGINNSLDDTVASEMKTFQSDFDKVTYRSNGKNWFVLSGYKGDDILYIKAYVGAGSINHLWIQYPRSMARKFDAMAAKISASFKPGNLTEIGDLPGR